MTVPTIMQDRRDIHAIEVADADASYYEVGKCGYTKIAPYYEENGFTNHGPSEVPWFAVYVSDFLVARIPADRCQMIYYGRDATG